MGRGDPCFRVGSPGRLRLAISGPSGPLAVSLAAGDGTVSIEVTGPDPEWLTPLLPRLLGLRSDHAQFDSPPRLRDLANRYAGLRLPQVPAVVPRVVQIVLQQLVSFRDAAHGWRELVTRHGETAGENPVGQPRLIAPPSAKTLAKLPSHEYVACGILPQHARRIVGVAREATKLEADWAGGLRPDSAERVSRRLAAQPGIGPWTLGYLRGAGLGDSDAVVLGDYSFPRSVAYFFANPSEADAAAEKATDEEMLRLLEPYRPYRFYVLSLILKGGGPPLRKGPHRPPLRDRL